MIMKPFISAPSTSTRIVLLLLLASFSHLGSASSSPTYTLAPSFGVGSIKVKEASRLNNDSGGNGLSFNAAAAYISPIWLMAELGIASQSNFDSGILQSERGESYRLSQAYAMIGLRLPIGSWSLTPKIGLSRSELTGEFRNGRNKLAKNKQSSSDTLWELQLDSNDSEQGIGFLAGIRGTSSDNSDSLAVAMGPIFYF